MRLSFEPARPRRRPSLTPMIDVVFLLLVFFMLAARIGSDGHMALNVAGQDGTPYAGPPRLVEVGPDMLTLNGVAVQPAVLPARLAALTAAPSDTVVLRVTDGTDLQRLVTVMEALRAAGFADLVLVE